MGVTSFQQSLYEFFDSGLLFRIALLQKTILFLLFWIVKVMLSLRILQFIVPEAVSTLWVPA